MKALTVKQPWAGSIFRLGKDVENRSWSTPYRGPLLIHSSSSLYLTNKKSEDLNDDPAWAMGSIIGVVELVEVKKNARSVWSHNGSWHWVFENAFVFDKAIPAKGAMGLWKLTPELTGRILDLL